MKKTTLATIKSFIRKNEDKLHINLQSRFDGMTDCCESCHAGFEKTVKTDRCAENTLGIEGAWFVKGSADYFRPYDDGKFKGYEVYNCCGRFVLAVAV